MSLIQLIAILITVVTLFSYINYRWVKLSTTIGLMVIAGTASLAVMALNQLGIPIENIADELMGKIDFGMVLLQGMLSFLLFSGALQIDLAALLRVKGVVLTVALVGTILSTFIIGGLLHFVCNMVGQPLDMIYCLLFGALISPTDPIAVIALLKRVKAPKELEMKIAGESLFNDGVGIVLFTVILSLINNPGSSSALTTGTIMFLREAVGGALFGFVTGWIIKKLIEGVEDHSVQVLLSLALVMGGYALALYIHVSAPIAMVVAGLLVGSAFQQYMVGDHHHGHSHFLAFWEIIDEVLNSILFALIGLEMVLLPFTQWGVILGFLAVPIILIARWISVHGLVKALSLTKPVNMQEVKILVWGGLKGGLALAMALSIPPNPYRELLMVATYVVVIFSLIVQGLTFKNLLVFPQQQKV
ncbi:MAG: putative Na+/H+ antiporter [Chlamydiales bacterium]|jgi:CPA1 family monovalent cation:H+ antiporter|nr:putative Na+/H+ antiporter [Chlamydiales bacterium]